jgi:hypothetical protein
MPLRLMENWSIMQTKTCPYFCPHWLELFLNDYFYILGTKFGAINPKIDTFQFLHFYCEEEYMGWFSLPHLSAAIENSWLLGALESTNNYAIAVLFNNLGDNLDNLHLLHNILNWC